MFAKTYGATTLGIDGVLIEVEADVTNGLPKFEIVGLADVAVKEAKERVRPAIRNTNVNLMPKKVTINLAPADLRKNGSSLDLPIAIALLEAYGFLPKDCCSDSLLAAELSLDGQVKTITGILSMTILGKELNFKRFFVAKGNEQEALLVEGIEVYAISKLSELIDFLQGKIKLKQAKRQKRLSQNMKFKEDFARCTRAIFSKKSIRNSCSRWS